MGRATITIDGNEAASRVAYQLNEVIAIYPITPSSPMGEWSDQWAAEKQPNLWGTVPTVVEMQSEGGAAGAVHGALQAGALTATFTSSQGLLLMIPNMYKIAGELTPAVFHVAARAVAAHALSIFGDHSDVMAVRGTGWALMASNSVQEVTDLAAIAQAASLESRIPVLHFFDGFRTSHEVSKIEPLTQDDLRALIDEESVRAHRARALSPDHPVVRGTAQNPDVFFQARESVNPYYLACPGVVQRVMDRFAKVVGRSYHLFDYVGAPDAERVIVMMGSGAGAAEEAVRHLVEKGDKVGLVKVRLYRPFSVQHFVAALPPTVETIAVLDRTKEPGAAGEPLYQDVVTALSEAMTGAVPPLPTFPRVIGGRYGLSSKEFTPAMVKAVLDEAASAQPKNHFTIGIDDDVTGTSLPWDPAFSTEHPDTVRAMFYGLGADGTVSANKNSIKIIGEGTDNYAQGYFVYDSKKSGTMTTSHLRFGKRPITSTYLIDRASFVAVHNFTFLERFDLLAPADRGATVLLNSPFGPDEVWNRLPATAQREILEKDLKLYVIDGFKVAADAGLGTRISTVMQTCFFAISRVIPADQAIAAIKDAIQHTYGRKGESVVQKNFAAVDSALAQLHEVKVPKKVSSAFDIRPPVPAEAPPFVQKVTAEIIAGRGNQLPVSAMPDDGTFPSATAQWERRNIALEIPVLDEALCIQCGKCVLVCPHAAIRAKVVEPALLAGAPPTFKSMAARWREFKDRKYVLQVAPEDCTGCELCVMVCPVKSKTDPAHRALNMQPQLPLREPERANWSFFLSLPETDRTVLRPDQVKDVQLFRPLFEFSGACSGCGETPYLKLMSQLFGDRAIVANATGCSSIYGGNLPTTPWSVNGEGRGPAWSNSLFEDNAEFGMGMRLSIDKQAEFARELVTRLAPRLEQGLAEELVAADQSTEAGIAAQRVRVDRLKEQLARLPDPEARRLETLADSLVRKSVWIVGGDGWAYDIGYGGLDHVLNAGRNVNVLVLDSEVYSNTGGQASKATPRGAVAKFAAGGKPVAKKDLTLMAMAIGSVYVARVAFGADDAQLVRAFLEADAYDGPSIIVAYSHCIEQGYDMIDGLEQQKNAVKSGHWPLFRFNPARAAEGKNPLQLDSKKPSIPISEYEKGETRFTRLKASDPEAFKALGALAQRDADARWLLYEQLAAMAVNGNKKSDE
ncbi:MAG TPA: pyruvate:ferredoxin (flavodoxin) oxidoreductase [Gemmatimonadales bacterium]|nr:pyruvate:ferredoxin (flavodoxin) oxidoreductase [Gemmatimonadales bacterium]